MLAVRSVKGNENGNCRQQNSLLFAYHALYSNIMIHAKLQNVDKAWKVARSQSDFYVCWQRNTKFRCSLQTTCVTNRARVCNYSSKLFIVLLIHNNTMMFQVSNQQCSNLKVSRSQLKHAEKVSKTLSASNSYRRHGTESVFSQHLYALLLISCDLRIPGMQQVFNLWFPILSSTQLRGRMTYHECLQVLCMHCSCPIFNVVSLILLSQKFASKLSGLTKARTQIEALGQY